MNLPCINCLIFPICRHRYNNAKLSKNAASKGSFVLFEKRNAVVTKCSILDDYFREKMFMCKLKKSVDEFHKVFRGGN